MLTPSPLLIQVTVPEVKQFQQPPTNSGLPPALDWAAFISLLLLVAGLSFRQIQKAGNADQKVLETLIQDLRESNAKNSEKLAEIALALNRREMEEASTVFRIRSTEQKLDALHRRLDLVGAPHSNDPKKE